MNLTFKLVQILVVMTTCPWTAVRGQDVDGRFAKADASLNQVYRAITGALPPQVLAPLRESQRIWLEFRDANAALAAAVFPSDSLAGTRQMIEDTERRTSSLTAIFLRRERVAPDVAEEPLLSADRDLNAEYQRSLVVLSSAAGELRSAQRAWVAHREPDRDDPHLAAVRTSSGRTVRSIPVQPIIAEGVSAARKAISDLQERHFVDLRIGAGAAVLASSTAQQQSLETDEVSNGLFTAAILQGIKQRKADLDADGIVRASELIRYSRDEVMVLSDGAQNPVSRHVNLSDHFTVVRFR